MKKNIVVLSGAGISAESGLSTFRDDNGLWDNYNVEDVASIDGWVRNNKLVLDFYNERRRALKDVMPNDAHYALAKLEEKYNVTIITQNVDNLHERAGSTVVLHLHGELTKVRPEVGAYDVDNFSEREVFDIGYEDVNLGDLAPNKSQLRPHIVWFGEAVPKMTRAMEIVSEADIFLIIGTSLKVYPAAGLYRYVKPDAKIYIIDPSDFKLFDRRTYHIKEKATVGVPKFIQLLEENI